MKYVEKSDVPTEVAKRILDRSGWLRRQAVNERDKVRSGDLPLPDFLQFCESCRVVRDDLIGLRDKVQNSKVGAKIVAELQEQVDGTWANPAADMQTFVAGINTFLAAVETNFPKDGNGRLLHFEFAGDGSATLVQRRFQTPGDAAQLTTIEGWLDALIALWV